MMEVLYDRNLRHERVKSTTPFCTDFIFSNDSAKDSSCYVLPENIKLPYKMIMLRTDILGRLNCGSKLELTKVNEKRKFHRHFRFQINTIVLFQSEPYSLEQLFSEIQKIFKKFSKIFFRNSLCSAIEYFGFRCWVKYASTFQAILRLQFISYVFHESLGESNVLALEHQVSTKKSYVPKQTCSFQRQFC